MTAPGSNCRIYTVADIEGMLTELRTLPAEDQELLRTTDVHPSAETRHSDQRASPATSRSFEGLANDRLPSPTHDLRDGPLQRPLSRRDTDAPVDHGVRLPTCQSWVTGYWS